MGKIGDTISLEEIKVPSYACCSAVNTGVRGGSGVEDAEPSVAMVVCCMYLWVIGKRIGSDSFCWLLASCSHESNPHACP